MNKLAERYLTLSLILILAVPSSAFALRPAEKIEASGLEELADALRTGNPDDTVQAVRKGVRQVVAHALGLPVAPPHPVVTPAVTAGLEELSKEETDKRLRAMGLDPDRLQGADLSRKDLSGFDLRNRDLTGAELTDAILSHADLSHANLRGAKLVGTILFKANFRDANLREVDLDSADLRDADLTGAHLESANLASLSVTSSDIKWPEGFDRNRLHPAAGLEEVVTGETAVQRTRRLLSELDEIGGDVRLQVAERGPEALSSGVDEGAIRQHLHALLPTLQGLIERLSGESHRLTIQRLAAADTEGAVSLALEQAPVAWEIRKLTELAERVKARLGISAAGLEGKVTVEVTAPNRSHLTQIKEALRTRGGIVVLEDLVGEGRKLSNLGLDETLLMETYNLPDLVQERNRMRMHGQDSGRRRLIFLTSASRAYDLVTPAELSGEELAVLLLQAVEVSAPLRARVDPQTKRMVLPLTLRLLKDQIGADLAGVSDAKIGWINRAMDRLFQRARRGQDYRRDAMMMKEGVRVAAELRDPTRVRTADPIEKIIVVRAESAAGLEGRRDLGGFPDKFPINAPYKYGVVDATRLADFIVYKLKLLSTPQKGSAQGLAELIRNEIWSPINPIEGPEDLVGRVRGASSADHLNSGYASVLNEAKLNKLSQALDYSIPEPPAAGLEEGTYYRDMLRSAGSGFVRNPNISKREAVDVFYTPDGLFKLVAYTSRTPAGALTIRAHAPRTEGDYWALRIFEGVSPMHVAPNWVLEGQRSLLMKKDFIESGYHDGAIQSPLIAGVRYNPGREKPELTLTVAARADVRTGSFDITVRPFRVGQFKGQAEREPRTVRVTIQKAAAGLEAVGEEVSVEEATRRILDLGSDASEQLQDIEYVDIVYGGLGGKVAVGVPLEREAQEHIPQMVQKVSSASDNEKKDRKVILRKEGSHLSVQPASTDLWAVMGVAEAVQQILEVDDEVSAAAQASSLKIVFHSDEELLGTLSFPLEDKRDQVQEFVQKVAGHSPGEGKGKQVLMTRVRKSFSVDPTESAAGLEGDVAMPPNEDWAKPSPEGEAEGLASELQERLPSLLGQMRPMARPFGIGTTGAAVTVVDLTVDETGRPIPAAALVVPYLPAGTMAIVRSADDYSTAVQVASADRAMPAWVVALDQYENFAMALAAVLKQLPKETAAVQILSGRSAQEIANIVVGTWLGGKPAFILDVHAEISLDRILNAFGVDEATRTAFATLFQRARDNWDGLTRYL